MTSWHISCGVGGGAQQHLLIWFGWHGRQKPLMDTKEFIARMCAWIDRVSNEIMAWKVVMIGWEWATVSGCAVAHTHFGPSTWSLPAWGPRSSALLRTECRARTEAWGRGLWDCEVQWDALLSQRCRWKYDRGRAKWKGWTPCWCDADGI